MSSSYRRQYEVDILLRGFEGQDMTQNLIRSIMRNTDRDKYHITYVDNGSKSEPADTIREFPTSAIQTVRLPFNHGSVRAINVGLSLAMLTDAPYILLLDNDTEIPDGDSLWLDRWVSYFDDPKVACAGAVSNYTSGYQNCEALPDTYNKDWEVEGEGAGLKELPNMPLLVSFAMMLRKSAVAEVGLFDERFEPGNCEDYDYTLRLTEAGYKNVIARSVWIHHKGSQTFGKMDFQGLLDRNFQKFVDKHGRDKLKQLGVTLK